MQVCSESFSPRRASVRLLRQLGCVVAMLVVLSLPAMAQVGQSVVSGTVEDSTGAIIPGATITLTDVTNGVTRTAKSDGRGYFSFSMLPASTFQVSLHMDGFTDLVRKNIVLHIGDHQDVPQLKMEPATATQTVDVSAESDSITPTTSGESAYTISSKQIQNLNIQGRSAMELLGLVPGAANAGNFNSSQYSGTTAGFSNNSSGFSINGNRFDQTQIVSDGAAVTDINTAGAAAVTPNVDMVSEAKVETSAFLPENPNGPVVVNTETKSGGHDYHGELYASVRNAALNTTDWRVKNELLPKPNEAYYYPGVNIGGPVLFPGFNKNRDKLFFFAGFEKSLQYVQDPLLDIRETVSPTAAMRTGDFTDTAYLSSLNSSASWYATQVPCASSGDNAALCTSPGTIDPSQIDPNGKLLLNKLPLPNVDPTQHNGYNLVSSAQTFQPRDQENLKIDYNVNNNNHFSARYNHEAESIPFPYGYYNTFTTDLYPAGQFNHNDSNSVVGNLASAFSASLSNQLVFSYTRLNMQTYLHNESAVSRSVSGYTGPDLYNNNTDILPNVQPGYGGGGYASLYTVGGSYPTTNAPQETYSVNESITKMLASHTIKAGFYYAQQGFGQLTHGLENGLMQTGEYGNSYQTGNIFADLLVGRIAYFQQSSKNFVAYLKERRSDFFVQDQWKVTQRFNLNYGVRVNHIGSWYEQNGRMVVFDPSLYSSSDTFADAPGLVTHATHPSTPISGNPGLGFQIAPDVGFAWDFFGTGMTILRGGFGTNNYVDPGNNAFSTVQAPPNQNFTSYYGLTTISNIPNLQTYLPLGVYGIADRTNTKLPVTRSYTLALSQGLPGGMNMELSYNGNASKYLVGYLNTNPVPEGCPNEYLGYTPGTYNDTLCRPYGLLDALSTEKHNLSSYYNSLQATASKRTGVVNFWLTYTWGKTMAYNCENAFDERRCYNPAPFDISQNLNISYVINLPSVGAHHLGNHKVVNGILDGWQITGIEQFSSGAPLGVSAAASANGNSSIEYDGTHTRTLNFYGVSDAANNYSSPNFDNRITVGTPDEQGVPTLVCDPRANLAPHQYFKASCFRAPNYGTANSPSIGTYRLPYIHGPRAESDTIGLYKSFKFSGQRSFQLRAQVFDMFNHAYDSFVQYDPNLYLEYDAYGGLPVNTAKTGYASTRIGHRTVQLEGKIYF
ncbi:MAG: carboxypeptidase regulatory-like domain-containing protein [Acidobacteriaceae bacterium]|nr:carboxypeptidase regulatory-like domain-containing protein [Acidobacteriaceae bacterium]